MKNIAKEKFRVLTGMVKVKNASVVFDQEKKIYHLIHYDTEICRIEAKTKKVIFALKCSQSSSRAIKQLCENLDIDFDSIELRLYDRFYKYEQSTPKRLTKDDYLEFFE